MCCYYHAFLFMAPFSQEIYQSFDISDLFNLLAYLIETDKQGKKLPERVRVIGYFYNALSTNTWRTWSHNFHIIRKSGQKYHTFPHKWWALPRTQLSLGWEGSRTKRTWWEDSTKLPLGLFTPAQRALQLHRHNRCSLKYMGFRKGMEIFNRSNAFGN